MFSAKRRGACKDGGGDHNNSMTFRAADAMFWFYFTRPGRGAGGGV